MVVRVKFHDTYRGGDENSREVQIVPKFLNFIKLTPSYVNVRYSSLV